MANIFCLGSLVHIMGAVFDKRNWPKIEVLMNSYLPLFCSGGGSGGLIIHVNTADHMTVSSSSNCNLQTGSAQQQGKRVREGGRGVDG